MSPTLLLAALLAGCAEAPPAPAPVAPTTPPPPAADPPEADALARLLLDLRAQTPRAVGPDGAVIDATAQAEQRARAAAAVELAGALELSGATRSATAALAESVTGGAPAAAADAAAVAALDSLRADAWLELAAPDGAALAEGAGLWARHCAACHGPSGEGPPPEVAMLHPAPLPLSVGPRASALSPQRAYLLVTQGVDGTAMVPLQGTLSDAQRWAVAFFAAGLSAPPGDAAQEGPVPPLEVLARSTNAELGAASDPARFAFLRGTAARRAATSPYLAARQATREVARSGDGLALLDQALQALPEPIPLSGQRRAALTAADPGVRRKAARALSDRLLKAEGAPGRVHR